MALLHLPLALAVLVGAGPGWLGVLLTEAQRPTVAEVIPESPAARAGLRPGDVILAIDGVAVAEVEAFTGLVAQLPAGTSVRLRVERSGAELQLEARLAVYPGDDSPSQPAEAPVERGSSPAPGAETAGAPVFREEEPGVWEEAQDRGVPVLELRAATPALERAVARILARPQLAELLEGYVPVRAAPTGERARGIRLRLLDPDGEELATLSGLPSERALRAFLEQCPDRQEMDPQEIARELTRLRREVERLRRRVHDLERRPR